jgi:Alpha-kinase family/von Willebrand factor type A domain
MLRSSLSCGDSLTATRILSASRDMPHFPTKESSVPETAPTSSPRTSVVESDSSKAKGETSPAKMPLVSSGTKSRTEERLRLAEEDLAKVHRALGAEKARAAEIMRRAEEEHALVERLKREGDSPVVSATEAKRRVRSLKRDERKATAEAPRGTSAGLFKAVCSTDLLFLIDTTSSMGSYIEAAKNQVKSIVADIGGSFLDEVEVRMAVVGYKDHSDSPNIEFLDFTTSAHQVRSFLDGLSATGGADTPEDVLGGIRQALNATWMHQTRCMIHIADAPPHGRPLHDMTDSEDTYANPGSEPHGLTHTSLLRQMIKLQINYALLRITSYTDRMALMFLKEYAASAADCTLLRTNQYYSEGCRLNPGRTSKGGLLFEEAELGISYSELQHLVVKVVTTSVSRTAVRNADRMKRAGSRKLPGLGLLTAIGEDDDIVPDVGLETLSPQWDRLNWFDEKFEVEGFSHDVMVHGANTLNDMLAHDDYISLNVLELTLHKRQHPFAQGALRVASYARTAASNNRYVVKSFKRAGSRLPELATDMRCQALCKAFALEFNALLGDKYAIDFVVTACFKGKEGKTTSDSTCISLEPFLPGTFVKYNNNTTYVNEEIPNDPSNKAAQAFSHFTFERSRGRFLVCDLQGVGKLMTDPVIHTLDPGRFILSTTNLGEDGFKFFFTSHKCNDVCDQLGLKSNASMFVSGRYEFRESWPTMADTVCCSNKLCGRILRRTNAKESAKFPGYRWCDVCWPQLELFKVKWICVAPGPDHEFEESRFFYESQGRSTPRKCSEHREEDIRARDGSAVSSNSILYKPTRRSTLRTHPEDREEDAHTVGTTVAKNSLELYEPRGRWTPRTRSEHREEDVHAFASDVATSRTGSTMHRIVTEGRKKKATSGASTGVVGRVWAKLKSATRSKKG